MIPSSDPDRAEAAPCEWQECDADAVSVRDTPWGELFVCAAHAVASLFGEDEKDDRVR
jgi:hypothetical protein